MKRLTRESQVFTEIARRFVMRKDNGFEFSICFSLTDLVDEGVISEILLDRCQNRINSYLKRPNMYAYHFPHSISVVDYKEKYKEARALACLWMAEEAKAEGV